MAGMRITRTIASLAFLLATAAFADKVKLEAKHKEGDVTVEKLAHTAELSGKMEQGTITISFANDQETKNEVLAAKDGKIEKVRRTFAVSTLGVEQKLNGVSMAPMEKNPMPLHGKTATIVADGDKTKVEEKFPEVAEMGEDERRLAPAWDLLLPAGEVESGATWALAEAQVMAFFGSDDCKGGTMSCALQSVGEEQGRKVAKISFEFDAKMSMSGSPGGMKGKGTILWDLEGGHPRSFEMDGTMSIDDADIGKLEGPMKVAGTVEKTK